MIRRIIIVASRLFYSIKVYSPNLEESDPSKSTSGRFGIPCRDINPCGKYTYRARRPIVYLAVSFSWVTNSDEDFFPAFYLLPDGSYGFVNSHGTSTGWPSYNFKDLKADLSQQVVAFVERGKQNAPVDTCRYVEILCLEYFKTHPRAFRPQYHHYLPSLSLSLFLYDILCNIM